MLALRQGDHRLQEQLNLIRAQGALDGLKPHHRQGRSRRQTAAAGGALSVAAMVGHRLPPGGRGGAGGRAEEKAPARGP